MNIKEIEQLSLVDQMKVLKKNGNAMDFEDIEKNIMFFNNKHPILIDPDMDDYTVQEERIDSNGMVVKDAAGKIVMDDVVVKRTRLVLPYAQQIVSSMVAWLYGSDISIVMEGDRSNVKAQDAFEKYKDILDKDVRLMSVLKEATRACGVETRSAIQFFFDKESDKIKADVLSYGKGYKLWRHKDDYGKVDCVITEYKRDKIVAGRLKTDVSTTDIWTAEGLKRYEGTKLVESQKSPMSKLLFDYLEQDYSEFEFVKQLISKQDYARSQHSEVNTKIGSPSLVVYGKLKKKPRTNGGVTIYEVNVDSDYDGTKLGNARMEYLQLETAPESVKLEMTMNENDIYRFTWPDLNKLMTDMKNGNMSGQSMKLTFLQAFVKLAEKQEQHDEFVQRALNIVRDMAAELYPSFTGMKDLKVSFHYNSILPDSTAELVNMLAVAVGAGITSQENAVRILDINMPETMQEIRKQQLLNAVEAQKTIETTENDRNKDGVNGE